MSRIRENRVWGAIRGVDIATASRDAMSPAVTSSHHHQQSPPTTYHHQKSPPPPTTYHHQQSPLPEVTTTRSHHHQQSPPTTHYPLPTTHYPPPTAKVLFFNFQGSLHHRRTRPPSAFRGSTRCATFVCSVTLYDVGEDF